YQPDYVSNVLSSGRCSVNVWGAVSLAGLGPLVRLPPSFNSASYCDLPDNTLIPYALDGPSQDGCFIFQHDCSPIHTANSVRALLEERAVHVLDWVPKGANFNIIENVWGTLKSRLARMNLRTASADDLWMAVRGEWEHLSQRAGYVEALFESLPGRMQEAVRLGG
ncbi:hypothetical protein HPB47_002404, partial [Ixodes persulcatus]